MQLQSNYTNLQYINGEKVKGSIYNIHSLSSSFLSFQFLLNIQTFARCLGIHAEEDAGNGQSQQLEEKVS